MKVISVNDPILLRVALRVLRRGGVVAFPTETSYGLGCDSANQEAVNEIFSIKQRRSDKPLLVVVPSIEMAKKYLRLPASLGYSLNFASVTEKVNDIGFSTAIGLVRWGSNMVGTMRSSGRSGGGMIAGIKKAGAVQGVLRRWLKALIP